MTAEAAAADTAVAAVPPRSRLARIRALFNPEAVPVTEIADLAADDLNRAWISGYEQLSVTGFWSIARRLPALLAAALRLAAAASRPRTVWLLALQAVAGVCQAVSLFATTGALGALIASGPTPDKISAALPSLMLIGALLAVQAGAIGVGQLLVGQLAPVMDAQALGRLQQLCTTVEAVAFDSAGWMDAEIRAERGAVSPRYLLQATVRVMRNTAGIIAAAIVLAAIDPLLLPLLALTIAPKLWAQIRSARQGYAVWVRQMEGKRRQNQIAQLGQSVSYAPEVRAWDCRNTSASATASSRCCSPAKPPRWPGPRPCPPWPGTPLPPSRCWAPTRPWWSCCTPAGYRWPWAARRSSPSAAPKPRCCRW
jgi:hypothetical protein